MQYILYTRSKVQMGQHCSLTYIIVQVQLVIWPRPARYLQVARYVPAAVAGAE